MSDRPTIGPIGPLSRTILLLAALGLGGTLAACADIHPAPNEPETGMLGSPTDEADQFRRAEERAHEDEEGPRQ